MYRNYQLPEGKRIHIYKSGDTHYTGANMVVNPMQIKNLDNFLSTVTNKVDPDWGAVRSIHTPQRGTVIESLDSINQEGVYVAAGAKGFVSVPGGYENIGKPGNKKKLHANHKPIHRGGLKNEVFNVTVYKNGDSELAIPFKFSKADYSNWDQALYRLSEKAKLPQGPVKRIYHLNGKIVKGPSDLVNNGTYVVAASGETFRRVGYGEVNIEALGASTAPKGSVYRSYSKQTSSSGRPSDPEDSALGNHSRSSMKLPPKRRTAQRRPEAENAEEKRRFSSNSKSKPYKYQGKARGRLTRKGSGNDAEGDRSWERETGRSTTQGSRRTKAPRVVSSKLQSSRSKPRKNSANDKSRGNTSQSNAQGVSSRQTSRRGSETGDGDEDTNNDRHYQRRRAPSAVTRSVPKQIPESSDPGSVDYLKLRSRQNTPHQSPSGTPSNSRPTTPQNLYDFRGRAGSIHEPIVEENEDEYEDEGRLSAVEELSSERGTLSRLSLIDSGHASLLSDEDRPDSVFRAKNRSRPVTQAREVDYDTDDGGIFRAKSKSEYVRGAKEILDSSVTEIELPVDLVDASEVQEEVAVS